MFKNTFQSGFLSILYSIGSKPLQIWDKKVSFVAFLDEFCDGRDSGMRAFLVNVYTLRWQW